MRKLSTFLSLAVVVVVSSSGITWASPLLTLQVLGSTSGQAGTYSNQVSAAPGTSISYELTLMSAPSGTTNTNTTKIPNGTTDSYQSIPYFTVSDNLGTFSSVTLNTAFGTGTGSSATVGYGSTGSPTNLIEIRYVAGQGTYVNDDTAQVVATGSFIVGNESTETLAGALYTANGVSGAFKIAGSLTSITPATEGSADPYLGYSALTISTAPEPASLSLLGLSGLTMLRRRRATRSAGLSV